MTIRRALLFFVLISSAASVALSQTQSGSPGAASRARLQLVAVDVDPKQTAADVLHRLRVRIRNDGTDPASDLMFQVTVSGQQLATYLNHVFTPDLPPGKETDVQLYNFWSSEGGRPFPKDGRVMVSVQLTAARWRPKGAAPREITPLPAAVTATVPPRK